MQIIPLLAYTALLLGQAPSSATQACSPENEQSHRLALNLATSDSYVNPRATALMPKLAASQVRVLTDAADAAICQRMLTTIQQRATASGANLSGSVIVNYQAGSQYVAVVTYPRPTPPPPPSGYAHIRTGWTAVFVFDQSFTRVTPLAL
jgi:hypothetical protein